MTVARCITGCLLSASVALFVAYCVLMPLNVVLLSSWFQKLTAICHIPYISQALQSSEEEEALSFLSQDRQYSAAVSASYTLSWIWIAACGLCIVGHAPSCLL